MFVSKLEILLTLVSLFLSFSHNGECAQAYFMLNSECKNVYSCVGGDTHDISVICFNGRCTCDPRLGIYDPLRYKCVGRGDHVCLGELCTRNAFCDGTTHTCKCQPSYNITEDGVCVHGYDEACEENEDCKSGLLCYDGKCDCRYPAHQYYHAENDTCHSIVKSLVNANTGTHEEKSLFRILLEILLTMIQVGILLAIALTLFKIVNALNGIAEGLKRHYCTVQSGSLQQGCHVSNVGTGTGTTENMKLVNNSFFDGIESV